MTEELPIFHCWRCGAECDTDWIEIQAFWEREPRVVQGETRCSNERCMGRFDRMADKAPTPEELARRGQEALDRVNRVWTDL